MAGPTGFEPATSRLTIWRPNLAERRPRNNLVLRKQPTKFFHRGSACDVGWSIYQFESSVCQTLQMVGGTGIEPVTSAV